MLLNQVGVIKTSFKEAKGTPTQSIYSKSNTGMIEIFPEYVAALKDLDGFDRIWLIYWLHQSLKPQETLKVTPFHDNVERGIFATRAPCRPNPLGLSSVHLIKIENNILHIMGVDIIDGTPLLDIKPYIAKFDVFPDTKNGWLEDKINLEFSIYADNRFISRKC